MANGDYSTLSNCTLTYKGNETILFNKRKIQTPPIANYLYIQQYLLEYNEIVQNVPWIKKYLIRKSS